MGLRHYFKTLKRRTIQNKLNIIVGLVIFVLLVGLVNYRFSMRVMSGTRAYVGGEGLWSKAQKEAVSNLVKYTSTHDETDYRKFLAFTEVQLGDKQARLEMDKPEPDRAVIRDGFIKGGNHPDDVRDLIFLYMAFRDVSYMKDAIQIWADADVQIERLLRVGEQIHQQISTPLPEGDTRARATRDALVSAQLKEVYDIDTGLTILENDFSATLNEGARVISRWLLWLTIGITVLLGALSLLISRMITKALVRLDKLKTEFVSMASHQLRTPLTAMNWSSESLLAESAGNLNPAQKKYVEGLYEGGQRMSSLIGDLLRVSSLDLGTYELEEREVEIGGLLETILEDQQQKIRQKDLQVTTNIDANVPTLWLDGQLLTVILQNLVSNSVKYTHNRGRINIRAEVKKNHLLIIISDNGIGIPASQQSQIFSKIFRADNAKKISYNESTGLGLYIAKTMVQRLGGKIWFDSVENKGSNFYVKLPVNRGHYVKRDKQDT